MQPTVTVVGAGPAGLMAAELAAGAGAEVTIIDQRRSFGRTLLLAGRSGLNLTHAEPLEVFLGRYGDGRAMLGACDPAFPPDACACGLMNSAPTRSLVRRAGCFPPPRCEPPVCFGPGPPGSPVSA